MAQVTLVNLVVSEYLSTVVALSLGKLTASACIIEGGLLTQVQTHAMETLGPINLAVL